MPTIWPHDDTASKIKFFGNMEEKRTGEQENWAAWGLGEKTRNDHFGNPKTAPNLTARVANEIPHSWLVRTCDSNLFLMREH